MEEEMPDVVPDAVGGEAFMEQRIIADLSGERAYHVPCCLLNDILAALCVAEECVQAAQQLAEGVVEIADGSQFDDRIGLCLNRFDPDVVACCRERGRADFAAPGLRICNERGMDLAPPADSNAGRKKAPFGLIYGLDNLLLNLVQEYDLRRRSGRIDLDATPPQDIDGMVLH